MSATVSASSDPRITLLNAPMSPYQWVAVLITVALGALDGYDVLAVTLVAPDIVREWGINRAELGIVFGIGLAGMAAGSFFVAPTADRWGRRSLLIANVSLMSAGMLMCANAGSIGELALWRFITGIGIGTTVATINPLAAEYSNRRHRDLAIALMTVGFPLGGVLGGAAGSYILAHYAWPTVFVVGSAAGAVLVLLLLWRLPEPVAFLIEKQGPAALKKVNLFLSRCGHAPVTELPAPAPRTRARLREIFQPQARRATLQITAIFFLFIMTVYFFLNWIPQMVADLGFAPSQAAKLTVAVNLCGIVGGTLLGWGATHLGLKPLALCALLGLGLATMAFGFTPADLGILTLSAAVVGFFFNSGMVSLNALIARTFPTSTRATGAGFVIGVGRIGSALSPVIAGYLFHIGLERGVVSLVMGMGAVLACALLLSFKVRSIEP
ncbi:MAG: MFS transporter [Steroidobacteraceae bacterium]